MLKAEEEHMLAVRRRERRDGSPAHRLLTSHLRLVVKIAMAYRRYGMPPFDLISEGNIGLLQAIQRPRRPRTPHLRGTPAGRSAADARLALKFRISRERVRQIETRTFKKVQRAALAASAKTAFTDDSPTERPLRAHPRNSTTFRGAPTASGTRISVRADLAYADG
jgi:RNA polymerase sigma-32 factor